MLSNQEEEGGRRGYFLVGIKRGNILSSLRQGMTGSTGTKRPQKLRRVNEECFPQKLFSGEVSNQQKLRRVNEESCPQKLLVAARPSNRNPARDVIPLLGCCAALLSFPRVLKSCYYRILSR